jgi:hypothetical protein
MTGEQRSAKENSLYSEHTDLGMPLKPQPDTSRYVREVRHVISDGIRNLTAPLRVRERRFGRWQIAVGKDSNRNSKVMCSSFCNIRKPENPASLDEISFSLLSCIESVIGCSFTSGKFTIHSSLPQGHHRPWFARKASAASMWTPARSMECTGLPRSKLPAGTQHTLDAAGEQLSCAMMQSNLVHRSVT